MHGVHEHRLTRVRFLGVLAGILLGLILFPIIANTLASKKSLADRGLGIKTTSHIAEYRGRVISTTGHKKGYDRLGEVVQTAKHYQEKGHGVALWLGNSQLHGINEFKSGDNLAAYYANDSAAENGSDIFYVQMSYPNASPHDMLAMYLIFRDTGLRPDYLITGIVYDDMREGVKQCFLDRLPDLETDKALLSDRGVQNLLAEKSKLNSKKNFVDNNSGSGASTASYIAPQKLLESRLEEWFELIWPPYEKRNSIYGNIVYELKVLDSRIRKKFTSVRLSEVTDSDREWNENALRSLISITKADGTELFYYKAPHRPGEKKFYYNRAKYDAFFNHIRGLSEENGAHYTDLELIVPAEYYGYFFYEIDGVVPDVMHFKDYGHRQLGTAVEEFVRTSRGG
jgi:hypothetical protein